MLFLNFVWHRSARLRRLRQSYLISIFFSPSKYEIVASQKKRNNIILYSTEQILTIHALSCIFKVTQCNYWTKADCMFFNFKRIGSTTVLRLFKYQSTLCLRVKSVIIYIACGNLIYENSNSQCSLVMGHNYCYFVQLLSKGQCAQLRK